LPSAQRRLALPIERKQYSKSVSRAVDFDKRTHLGEQSLRVEKRSQITQDSYTLLPSTLHHDNLSRDGLQDRRIALRCGEIGCQRDWSAECQLVCRRYGEGKTYRLEAMSPLTHA
jgi:hypothetical protein